MRSATSGYEATEEGRERVETVFRGWLTHALRVERVLLDVTLTLDRAGIDSRVLKGVALSHTAYSDPSERVFGDVDLLVPGDPCSDGPPRSSSTDSTLADPSPSSGLASTTASARRR